MSNGDLDCGHDNATMGGHSTPQDGTVCCYCYHQHVRAHFQMGEVLLDSLGRWVDGGTAPGGFLSSVLRNDKLSVAVRFADERTA